MAITVTSQHLGLDGSSEATDKLLVSGAGIKTVDALNRWQTAGGQTPTQQGVDKCGYTRPSPKPPLLSGRRAHPPPHGHPDASNTPGAVSLLSRSPSHGGRS